MSAISGSHTVILMQFTGDDNSRTYLDFETVNEALEGILQIFEQKLKTVAQQEMSTTQTLTYSLADLIAYLDKLQDCCCLTYNDV